MAHARPSCKIFQNNLSFQGLNAKMILENVRNDYEFFSVVIGYILRNLVRGHFRKKVPKIREIDAMREDGRHATKGTS